MSLHFHMAYKTQVVTTCFNFMLMPDVYFPGMLAACKPKLYEITLFGLKELTCQEAMNLVSSSFPLRHRCYVCKSRQVCPT